MVESESVSYLEGAKKIVPITYYGGKANHLDFILPLLKPNKKFIEAFCGSSVISLNHTRSEIEIINDIASRVSNFFEVLRNNIYNDQLLDQISLSIVSEEDFKKAKIISSDPIEEARRFYILANQSFMSTQKSWQYTPNVVRQSMSQNVSRWLGRFPLVQRTVYRIKMMQIRNVDGIGLIKKSACKNTTVYSDPPYPKEIRTSYNVYQHEMSDEQHIAFCETADKSPADIAISSFENELYDEYLLRRGNWNKVLGKVKKLAGHGSPRRETIYMNYHLDDIPVTAEAV